MLQDIHLRYRNGCMKLFRVDAQNHLVFLGTAFVVHPSGYLLTVSHILDEAQELVAVSAPPEDDFHPVSSDALRGMPVRVVSRNKDRDLALLAFEMDGDITMPDHVLGVPDAVAVGSSVASLGYAFGFLNVYTQVLQHAVVSAKMLSTNDTRLFLFESRLHEGSCGGPVVSTVDHRVVGVVCGRFDPAEASPDETGKERMPTGFTYAVSIEYAAELMEEAGLEVV